MSSPKTRPPRARPLGTIAPPIFFGAGLTHVGAVRKANEDAILTDPTGMLWAVADGMGGYGHGDLASDIVTQELSRVPDDAAAIQALRDSLHAANGLIQARSSAPGMGRMGATVVAMMMQNSVANIVWVGDCRAYLMRQGHLKMLTHDHTVVQELVDQGVLRDEQRDSHPESNIVTRAVGYEAAVEVDALSVPVVAGDRILLCSDGLTACLGDHEVADLMVGAAEPRSLCEALIQGSLAQGAPDNVSVISVYAQEGMV